jgi:membrane-associated phospholipid phosphatase
MAVSTVALETGRPAERTGSGNPRFRLVDIFTFVYFGTNTLLLAHPNRPDNWPLLLGLHLLFLAGVPLLVRIQDRHPLFRFLREWYPMVGLLAMYNEIQYLNRILTPDHFYDSWIIDWEGRLFGRQFATDLRGLVPWKPVGEAVHFGYFSYYFTLPALFVPLWLMRKYREFAIAMGVVAGTYYFCYLWYIFFPVTGPYWQFQPFPNAAAEGWFFPELTNRIVAGGSSRGSAFPSSHIAASVAVLGMAGRYLKPVYRLLFIPVILLCIGTVYGGFHYLIDAVAGLGVGLLAARFGPGIVVTHDFRRC